MCGKGGSNAKKKKREKWEREREGVGGRKEGLNCAALVPPFPLTLTSLPNLPTNREPPCACVMHIAHKHNKTLPILPTHK